MRRGGSRSCGRVGRRVRLSCERSGLRDAAREGEACGRATSARYIRSFACDTSAIRSGIASPLFSIDVYTRDALHHRAPESFSAVSSRRPSERPQLFMRCVYIRRGSSRARVRHISATASRRACSDAFTNRRRQCASPTTPAMTNFSPHDPMTPPVTPSTHSPILRALMTCLAFDVAHVVARIYDCTFTRGRLTPPNSP